MELITSAARLAEFPPGTEIYLHNLQQGKHMYRAYVRTQAGWAVVLPADEPGPTGSYHNLTVDRTAQTVTGIGMDPARFIAKRLGMWARGSVIHFTDRVYDIPPA